MDAQIFSQLGIGLATLSILLIVVKYFITSQTKKDEYIKEIVEKSFDQSAKFNETMNNHILHETEQSAIQTKALDKLVRAIESLVTRSSLR